LGLDAAGVTADCYLSSWTVDRGSRLRGTKNEVRLPLLDRPTHALPSRQRSLNAVSAWSGALSCWRAVELWWNVVRAVGDCD